MRVVTPAERRRAQKSWAPRSREPTSVFEDLMKSSLEMSSVPGGGVHYNIKVSNWLRAYIDRQPYRIPSFRILPMWGRHPFHGDLELLLKGVSSKRESFKK